MRSLNCKSVAPHAPNRSSIFSRSHQASVRCWRINLPKPKLPLLRVGRSHLLLLWGRLLLGEMHLVAIATAAGLSPVSCKMGIQLRSGVLSGHKRRLAMIIRGLHIYYFLYDPYFALVKSALWLPGRWTLLWCDPCCLSVTTTTTTTTATTPSSTTITATGIS